MFFYHVITFQLRQHFSTEHASIFTSSSHFSERLHFYTEHAWPSLQHCMRIHSDAFIHNQFLITAILHHTYIRNQIHTLALAYCKDFMTFDLLSANDLYAPWTLSLSYSINKTVSSSLAINVYIRIYIQNWNHESQKCVQSLSRLSRAK